MEFSDDGSHKISSFDPNLSWSVLGDSCATPWGIARYLLADSLQEPGKRSQTKCNLVLLRRQRIEFALEHFHLGSFRGSQWAVYECDASDWRRVWHLFQLFDLMTYFPKENVLPFDPHARSNFLPTSRSLRFKIDLSGVMIKQLWTTFPCVFFPKRPDSFATKILLVAQSPRSCELFFSLPLEIVLPLSLLLKSARQHIYIELSFWRVAAISWVKFLYVNSTKTPVLQNKSHNVRTEYADLN